MSIVDKKQQKLVWKNGKGWIPIAEFVSLSADLSNPHKNKHDKHEFHINIHETLTSSQPDTHKTLPIDNTHIGLAASRKAVEFGLKLAEQQKKPFMVDKDSRIYKAFDKAVNPLWSNELTEDPLKRNMRSEIGNQHIGGYKPTFNSLPTSSTPKPALKPSAPIDTYGYGKIGGYDMGRKEEIGAIRENWFPTPREGLRPFNKQETLKQANELASQEQLRIAYASQGEQHEATRYRGGGGTGSGGSVVNPFDQQERLRKTGRIWDVPQY